MSKDPQSRRDREITGYETQALAADARRRATVGLPRGGGTGANQHRAAGSQSEPAAIPTLAAAAYAAGNVMGGVIALPASLPPSTLSGVLTNISVDFGSVQTGGHVAIFTALPPAGWGVPRPVVGVSYQ